MPESSAEQVPSSPPHETTDELLARTDDLLISKDREFSEWIERAPDFMIVKYAREFIELRMEQKPDSRLRGMNDALCKRLQALQDRLISER